MSENIKIEPYRGYAKLEPVGNDDWGWLIFPLNEATSFTIGTALDCDLLLPPTDSNIPVPEAILHVGENGKISFENSSDPWSCGESLKVAGSILLSKEKCNLTEKTAIEFGPYSYSFQFTDTPTARYMKTLFETVKCAICSDILDDPRSLPCQHTFCGKCIDDLIDLAILMDDEPELQNQPKKASVNQENAAFMCPTCKEVVQISKLADKRSFKALAEVTKTIRELNDDRAYCVQCSNKRCLMHGSDYAFCEPCQIVLCPLCAMDGHREHDLHSNYVKAFRNGHDFVNNCLAVRQDWMEIYRKFQMNGKNVKNALKSAVACTDMLTNSERQIDEMTNNLIKYFADMENFQTIRWDLTLDRKRDETLRLFQKKYETFISSSNPLLANLNAKADVVLNPKFVSNLRKDNQLKSISAETSSLNSAKSPSSSSSSPTTGTGTSKGSSTISPNTETKI